MKGPLSADRLFYYSAVSFVVSFVLYTILNYVWPIPYDPAMMPSPTSASQIVSQISWILSIAGVVAFVLGLLARSK